MHVFLTLFGERLTSEHNVRSKHRNLLPARYVMKTLCFKQSGLPNDGPPAFRKKRPGKLNARLVQFCYKILLFLNIVKRLMLMETKSCGAGLRYIIRVQDI